MSSKRINGHRISRFTTGSALLSLVTLLLGGVSGEYDSSGGETFARRSLDGNPNGLCSGANCAERSSSVSGAMWFGPRLGRRRRSEEMKTESFNDDQINAIADVLQGAPWTLVSIHGDKRHANQFTPRLGRDSGEELLQKLLMGENPRPSRLIDSDDDIVDERQSPPPPPPQYAPRLGRRLPFTPSPRLGRRLRALLQKL